MLKKFVIPLFIGLYLAYPDLSSAATREEMLDIAKELHPPGCTDSMTADYCMLATAYDLRLEIIGMLDQGMDKNQIIDGLVLKYGDRILAAPKAEGFHLMAWLLPGGAIAVGGTAMVFLVTAWVRRTKQQRVATFEPKERLISEDRRNQIQEQLKEWI